MKAKPRGKFFPLHLDVLRYEDKYVDTVALDRAMNGDESVLDGMTPVERSALLDRVVEYYLNHGPHEKLDLRDGGEWISTTLGMRKAPPKLVIGFLWRLAEAWGIDYDYLRRQLDHRVRSYRVRTR